MNEELKKWQSDMEARVKAVEGQVALPTHYHNGFDSNQVSYLDLYQKKLYVHHTVIGTAAATAGNYSVFLIVPVACVVARIQEVHAVLGTDAGAVNVNVEKLTGTTVPGSGTAILATAFDLKAAINTVRTGTLPIASTARTLAAGNRLSLKLTGTPTAVANCTVLVELQF